MKRFAILLLLVSMVVSIAAVQAQDTLEPGSPVLGELTADVFEVPYTFAGTAGQAVVLEMAAVEDFSDLSSPELRLEDSTGSILVDTNEIFQFFGDFGNTYIAVVLPADDTYTVVATRFDGAEGDSVGEYNITLIVPTEMTPGETYSGTLSSAGTFDWYMHSSTDNFSVSYEKGEGEFWPELSAQVIGDDGSITGVGYLVGDRVTTGQMGVFEGGEVYFILVGELNSAFTSDQFYFDEVTTDYSISLTTES